jgi:hypothetical protein
MMKLKSVALGVLSCVFFVFAALGQTGQLPPGNVWGNPGASQDVAIPASISAMLDRALGSTRGAIIERGASGWAIIGPSATAGLPWISAGTGADPAYGVLGLVGGGCNAALTASNGGILYSTARACAIFAGTSTARLPLLSGANTTPVWGSYTLPASVISGGIPFFSSSSAQGSSALLVANQIMLGGGAGVAPATLGSLGTATTVLHGNASGPPTFGSVALGSDVSGTLQASNFPALTGDVTTTVGSLATTLANAPVIAKVLTGFTSGAGTVTAADSILSALQKINGNDALKAPLASPTLAGTPTAPTASPGTNTTQLASTAFVQAAVTGSVSGVASINGATGAIVGVDTNTLNAKTANYTIASTDCGSTIQAGTGSTGLFTITLPAVSGFNSACRVTVVNGDTGRGKTLSGFPTTMTSPNMLWPGQLVELRIVNGAWRATNPGRWKIPLNTTLFMDAINGSDSNDCLAAGVGNACLTFNQTLRTNVKDYYDLTGQTNFSAGNLSGSAGLVIQLADNATSAGACTTCYAGAHLDFSPVGYEGRASIVIRGDVANPQNVVVADNVLPNNIDVYSATFNLELDSLQIGQSSCSATPKSGGSNIQANDHAIVRLERNVVVGCTTGSQLTATSAGAINDDNGVSVLGGGFALASASDLGSVQLANQVVSCGGSPVYNTTITSSRMGEVNLQGVSWSGCGSVTGTRFNANELSLITTATGSPNTIIPGNANGSATQGSQVD